MLRIQQRLFRLNDRIEALRREERLMQEELSFHRHLDDDAQRDAAVSDHPIDRADARQTGQDVARFEAVLADLRRRRLRLEEKRRRLLDRLD